jgi:ABC-type nitrate/sulfonate/bicarbonate transport system substrate-binding protein
MERSNPVCRDKHARQRKMRRVLHEGFEVERKYLSGGFVKSFFRCRLFTPFCVIISTLWSLGIVFAQDLPKVTIAHSSRSIEAINFFMAEQHGYFKAEGLDVRIVQIRANVAIAAALAGDVDVLGSITSTISAIQKGAPIKVLAVTLNRPFSFSWLDRLPGRAAGDPEGLLG